MMARPMEMEKMAMNGPIPMPMAPAGAAFDMAEEDDMMEEEDEEPLLDGAAIKEGKPKSQSQESEEIDLSKEEFMSKKYISKKNPREYHHALR